jgi:hypothetical protein
MRAYGSKYTINIATRVTNLFCSSKMILTATAGFFVFNVISTGKIVKKAIEQSLSNTFSLIVMFGTEVTIGKKEKMTIIIFRRTACWAFDS